MVYMGQDRADAEAIVVGAGPAGLAAAVELRRRKVETVVLDGADELASSWRHRYEGLRLNSVRWLAGIRGARIPRSRGRWPSAEDYVGYLEDCARRRDLDVRLGTSVSRIDRAGSRYVLTTSAGELRAGRVVVATGYDRVPRLPAWPGRDTFAGELLHAADYLTPEPFAGRDVLVVGSGNSGTEIAVQLVRGGARRVRMALRTPPNIFPRELFGFPIHGLAIFTRYQPVWLADRSSYLLQRLAWGDLSEYGIGRAPHGLASELRVKGLGPVVDSGFVSEVRAGRVEIVPAVAGCDERDVLLDGGERVRPDVVIAATGYRHGLEELVGHLGVLDPSGRPLRIDGGSVPAAPNLHFNGYWLPATGQLHAMRATSRRIGREVAKARRLERSRARETRFYTAIRHPEADTAAELEPAPPAEAMDRLERARHCLVISYRRNGAAVATPVWFALDGDRLVFESDADSAKLKRLRRDPRVRIVPCTMRGRPLGPALETQARLLPASEHEAAERALAERYGAPRRVMSRLRPVPLEGLMYVEVDLSAAAPAAQRRDRGAKRCERRRLSPV